MNKKLILGWILMNAVVTTSVLAPNAEAKRRELCCEVVQTGPSKGLYVRQGLNLEDLGVAPGKLVKKDGYQCRERSGQKCPSGHVAGFFYGEDGLLHCGCTSQN